MVVYSDNTRALTFDNLYQGSTGAAGDFTDFTDFTAMRSALMDQMGVSNGSLNLWREVGVGGRMGSLGGVGGGGTVSGDFVKLAASLKV